ncbi:MAG: DNA polymerase IV [Eubacterium sp.]|nr:DNA polymerase IV [Eubacterium sp.]
MSSDHERIIFHIDVNSAFLSWSAIRLLESGSRVDLRTVPSIVGGDQKTRHGIVVAKSIPAKGYGIHTADTVASAFQKCPNLISVKPDHTYYHKKSQELMDYLKEICPRIQQVSVDECYMDYEPIRGKYASPEAAARAICDGVSETLGFTVNIGISDKKVLAKMASDFEKPNKVHTLYSGEIREKLWPLPIGTLYMCGRKSAEKLEQIGIRTIGDLAAADRSRIAAMFKSHGDLLWCYANGIDDSEVETEKREAKSVGNSTTLAEDAVNRDQALPVLDRLAESVSSRLKKKGILVKQVTVEIKYATFQSTSHQMLLESPTSDKDQIYNTAVRLFDSLWDGSPVRLLGIRTGKFQKEGEPYQLNLFDYQKQLEKQAEKQREQEKKEEAEGQKRRKDKERKQQMEDAIRKIEKKYGTGVIRKGFR